MRLDRAFVDGEAFANEYWSGTLTPQTITELVITSGQIAAGDGLIVGSQIVFARPVPNGRFPVTLSIAELSDGDRRTAYASVLFREAEVVRWEMAAPVGRTMSELADDEIFGYPVDTGIGGFMDGAVVPILGAMDDSDVEAFSDGLMKVLHRRDADPPTWAETLIAPERGLNLVVVSSGFGDDLYASYWGLDERNDPVCIVTDFGIVS